MPRTVLGLIGGFLQLLALGLRSHTDHQRESRGVVEAARLPPTLAVKGQLLAKKEILGG
jgi:hypothetical protein